MLVQLLRKYPLFTIRNHQKHARLPDTYVPECVRNAKNDKFALHLATVDSILHCLVNECLYILLGFCVAVVFRRLLRSRT